MKRRMEGQSTVVYRSRDIHKFFKLQSDICKCENEKCIFENETETSFSKSSWAAIKKECELHNLYPKGNKFVLITSLIDHYSTAHNLDIGFHDCFLFSLNLYQTLKTINY